MEVVKDENVNESAEEQAIDQIARFLVFTARDLYQEEKASGKVALPKHLINKNKSYEK